MDTKTITEHSLEKVEQLMMFSKAWDGLIKEIPPIEKVREKLRAIDVRSIPNILVVTSNKDHQIPSSILDHRIEPVAGADLIRILKLNSGHWKNQDMHSPFMGKNNELLKLLIDTTFHSSKRITLW